MPETNVIVENCLFSSNAKSPCVARILLMPIKNGKNDSICTTAIELSYLEPNINDIML